MGRYITAALLAGVLWTLPVQVRAQSVSIEASCMPLSVVRAFMATDGATEVGQIDLPDGSKIVMWDHNNDQVTLTLRLPSGMSCRIARGDIAKPGEPS